MVKVGVRLRKGYTMPPPPN